MPHPKLCIECTIEANKDVAKAEDDEDEGLRREAELNRPERSVKIEWSADALRGCHSPANFPSKCNLATTPTGQLVGQTGRRWLTNQENG